MSPPSSRLSFDVIPNNNDGDVSSPLSNQATQVLFDLIRYKESGENWDKASSRCRDHTEDARWKDDKYGDLPIHQACSEGAPLSLIQDLHEAYGEGVKTTNNAGVLPLHDACRSSSLEVIRYLHGQYPDGATKEDNSGYTPVDLLNYNTWLSEEGKAKAWAILSIPPGASTPPPRQAKHHAAGTVSITTTTPYSDRLLPHLRQPSRYTSTLVVIIVTIVVSLSRRKKKGTSKPPSSNVNSLAYDDNDPPSVITASCQRSVDSFRDNERKKATDAGEVAAVACARVKPDAVPLAEEASVIGDTGRDAMPRERKADDSVVAEDRDRLKPFFELGRDDYSLQSVELSVEYVRECTHDFSDEHRLGEGAFGVVYAGCDNVLRRRFAVKKIKYDVRKGSDDEDVRAARKMLKNELKVLNEFCHAHIARLYGFYLTEDLSHEQILVFELARRGSLDSFVKSERKRSELSWQRRVLIALHVASAVKFLHEGNCYHRDIKSANICIRSDYSAVLIDCGLAKMIPKEDSRDHGWSSSQNSGGQPGTIEYMCPQYATGLPVSDRTDVFAFGIVLLELLTGELQRRRPHGFYDKYVSRSGGGPGDPSLLVGDVDEAAGTWKSESQSEYSKLALECIQTVPNDRPTMREVFYRLGGIARTHCFLSPEELQGIDCGKQATMMSIRTLKDMISSRRWPEVATSVFRIDDRDCEKLFFFACRWGPSTVAVQSFLQVDDTLSRKFNDNYELPVHVVCCFGAEKGVIEILVRHNPKSLAVRSDISNETPLSLAQTRGWKYYKDEQADVVSFLRRKTFSQHFDGKTGLPGKSGFDLWAHIEPPGLTNANVALLYIDLAGLKAVNDNAGHTEGDAIIKKCAGDISSICDSHAHSTQSKIPCEVYRMGGDEFAVVCKFVGKPRNVWTNVLERLASSLSDLNYVDEREPARYSTFLRVGCAAGSLSNMENVLSKADELQIAVKRRIGLKRGECVPLCEVRRQGKKNVSDLCIL